MIFDENHQKQPENIKKNKKNPAKLVSVSVSTVFPEEENESREWSWRWTVIRE